MPLDVVTFGETMVLFAAAESGPLRFANTFTRHAAGTESNFAIGLARFGHQVGWFSRVKEILTKTFPNVLTWDALPGMPRGAKVFRVRLNQALLPRAHEVAISLPAWKWLSRSKLVPTL